MAEKDYKKLYEKSLEKNRHLKKQVAELKEEIADIRAERLSCDVEPLKGELFGRTLSLVSIDGEAYVRAELWTTERGCAGHIFDTVKPSTHIVFFRTNNKRRPIPEWCETMDLHFVINQWNYPEFVMRPEAGQPVHLLIYGDVSAWEGWNEEKVSLLQVEHDNYYLKKCAESAAEYVPIQKSDAQMTNNS